MNPDRLTWIGRTDSGVVRQRLYDREIGTLLLSPLDPKRKEWDAAIRKEGAATGRYIDPHWYGLAADGKALEFRKVCDAACAELQSAEMLMLDLELVSQEYVGRLIEGAPGNRGLLGSNNANAPTGTQANKHISYTNEPFKDATVVPYTELAEFAVPWYPQLYRGDMSPADGPAVVLEILRWMQAEGVGDYAADVHPFYDGKLIASDQRDGGWFTAERIPGVFTPTTAKAVFEKMQTAPWPLLSEASHPLNAFTKDKLRAHYTALAQTA